MTCTFSAEQITALSAPLDRAKVRQRRQGRSQVSYLEGWQVIAEAIGSLALTAGSVKPSPCAASTRPSG